MTKDGTAGGSEPGDLREGLRDVAGLRKDEVRDAGLVGHERVRRRDPLDGRIQVREELGRNPSGDLGAVAPGDRILVYDDRAARLPDRLLDRRPVVRRKAA